MAALSGRSMPDIYKKDILKLASVLPSPLAWSAAEYCLSIFRCYNPPAFQGIFVRRLLCILLLLCLPLQSFAMHGGALAFGSDAGMLHDLAHDERVQHHHEADGSVHYDESDESAQHVQDHSTSPQAADIALSKMPVAPEQLVSVLRPAFSRFIPEPYLDSPLRPPSPTLGHAAEGQQHA